MPLNLVEKIGFFHFVENFGDPIPALIDEIEKERSKHPNRDLRNSVIALPEVFNLGRPYGSGEPSDPPGLPASKILAELCEVAGLLGIGFVVGIGNLRGRRNSAYWVDECGPRLMCHKVGNDKTGIYEPFTRNPHIRNPIFSAGTQVGALICMDATEDVPNCSRCRQELIQGLKKSAGNNKIVCIPARFRLTNPKPLGILKGVPNSWYVVANGQWNSGFGSLIADSDDKVLTEEVGRSNRVAVWPLPRVPDRRGT